MTYYEAVHKAQECLERHQVPDADIDALLLLQFVCSVSRAGYYTCMNEEIGQEELDRYGDLVRRRAQRIPLQHLTGTTQFMGLSFMVNEDVLIPRQDTEILVEAALALAPSGGRVLDLCTGSGCILISLLKLGDALGGCGSDISGKALAAARSNADLNHVDAEFVRSDLFDGIEGTFDLIVSNPPYIPSGRIGCLMPEVRDHEPIAALSGGEDGLEFYRKIVPEALEHLQAGGWLLTEIGYDQGNAVRSMFDDARYIETKVIRDLGGNDRVVLGRKAIV